MNFNIGYIQNYREATAEDARDVIRGLDGVDVTPLFRQRGETYEETENIYGVVNATTDRVTMPVGGRYVPISHADGFSRAIDSIEHAGIDRNMMVRVENNGDSAGLYILFPDLMFNEDRDGGEMMYGVRFQNHYDRKVAFRGHSFCWRLQCSNGSTHAMLGELSVNTLHLPSQVGQLESDINGFVSQVLSNATRLDAIIDTAIESQIVFTDYNEVVRTLTQHVTKSDRRSKVIAEAIPLETNRWEVYNAVTEHASHADKVSWMTRDRLLASAERNVLMADVLTPVEAMVAVV